MKIAIVVQGRFHAFDLARALLARGHEVRVFTNYPKWAVEPFGISRGHVRSFPLHGVLSRIMDRVKSHTGYSADAWLHSMFGRWAQKQLKSQTWDVIHAWSGIAGEIYADPAFDYSLKLIMRGSAHIRVQARLLAEEQARVGHTVEQPSAWMVEREQMEYGLANRVVVLSRFALRTFREEGFPADHLRWLPLGTDSRAFRPGEEVVKERRRRILSGAPLRVLYVGGVTWQKGFADMMEIVKQGAGRFEFRIVGGLAVETAAAREALGDLVVFAGKKPHSSLPAEYAWGDVFLFPTIQDGYAVVLAQASAGALPILTTTNCSGPDLIEEGRTGWVLPIRNAAAFVERLQWCDAHREELAEMVQNTYRDFRTRDWKDVAADFEELCRSATATLEARRDV